MYEFMKSTPVNVPRVQRVSVPSANNESPRINQTVWTADSNPHKSFQENFDAFLQGQENNKNRFTSKILEQTSISTLYEVNLFNQSFSIGFR